VPSASAVPAPPRPAAPVPGWPAQVTHLDVIGSAVRRVEQRLRRLDTALHAMARGEPVDGTVTEVVRTPAMDVVVPRVSVLTANYQHGREVTEALASIAACHGPSVELLVQDDASTDGSVPAIGAFLAERPWLPASLFAASANRGASATRNQLLRHVRGEFVFVLDADNGVYPDILRRLVGALDEDPDAAFAYAPIAVRRGDEFVRLVSARPWLPEQLRHGNYIDAMALVRTDVLRELGGWDPEMDGWEDFHLWARMAEAGMHAAFVPQVLSWYRTSSHSLSVQVAVDPVGMWSRIRAAAPTLMHE
jgi:glycosyltransferase involved in cell wall biosynthesis